MAGKGNSLYEQSRLGIQLGLHPPHWHMSIVDADLDLSLLEYFLTQCVRLCFENLTQSNPGQTPNSCSEDLSGKKEKTLA